MRVTERLCEALRALPGVVEGRSRFGTRRNRAWTIDGREFAHLHSDSLLDLRLPGKAQRAKWVELEFRSESDVARIAALAAAAARANRKRK